MAVDMEYTPLKAISVQSTNSISVGTQGESYGERCGWDFTLSSTHLIAVAGVLYIHVHSASNLPSQDVDGLSDPYCVVLVNKVKVPFVDTWSVCTCMTYIRARIRYLLLTHGLCVPV